MNPKILSIAAVSLLLTTSVFAASNPVATVTAVSGDVKVETAQGKRMNATPNMQLAEGSTLLVLKGKANLKYNTTGCKQVYTPNTIVSINESSQCVVGQQMNVGAAGASAGRGPVGANFGRGFGQFFSGASMWTPVVIVVTSGVIINKARKHDKKPRS